MCGAGLPFSAGKEQGTAGTVRLGRARYGRAVHGEAGGVWHGMAGLGSARQAWRFEATQMIENEQTKLTATAINNLAVAIWIAGIVGPAVGFLYGAPGPETHGWWFLIGVVWLSVGFGLHMFARAFLRRMTP